MKLYITTTTYLLAVTVSCLMKLVWCILLSNDKSTGVQVKTKQKTTDLRKYQFCIRISRTIMYYDQPFAQRINKQLATQNVILLKCWIICFCFWMTLCVFLHFVACITALVPACSLLLLKGWTEWVFFYHCSCWSNSCGWFQLFLQRNSCSNTHNCNCNIFL